MKPPTPPDAATFLPMVASIVWKHFRSVPPHVADRDDLMQVGMEAVCRAKQRWTPEGGASFSAFAYTRIWGAIQDHLRQQSFGGRWHYQDVTVVSFDEPVGDDGLTRLDGYAATSGAEDDFVDPFIRDGIEDALAGASLDAQSAFALIQDENMTLAEVATMMEISESRVCQLVRHAREAIAAHPCMEGML